jgi:hypothetical protein
MPKPSPPDPGALALAAEMAARLRAAGLDDAAAQVDEAAAEAARDPERAAQMMGAAAEALMAQVPAYSRSARRSD